MTDRTIWLFWEGPRPPFIDLCIETIRRHHPDAVLLDRAGFERLRRHDRDLPIDGLSLNHLSDYVRAYLLTFHGGLYLDVDCILLRPLGPLLDMAAVHGFVGYREPQGYMSCNFMAARMGDRVARDHYARVAARIRQGAPFRWLDLASVQMEAAIAAHGGHALLLPTAAIMPLPWQDMIALLAERDDDRHDALFPADSWTIMLSNGMINYEPMTRPIATMPHRRLLGDRIYLAYLLRRALGLPPRDGGVARPLRHGLNPAAPPLATTMRFVRG
ncbi:glycosyltransferase [Sphingomonas profundi]|uniref:glycosyltransferase n=1 Tax=Alterirhizorhabdus profundi TaxID=2681549 RepID=UPI0012E95039|nr:glycosyltransferase [Sphingomonas profundi]